MDNVIPINALADERAKSKQLEQRLIAYESVIRCFLTQKFEPRYQGRALESLEITFANMDDRQGKRVIFDWHLIRKLVVIRLEDHPDGVKLDPFRLGDPEIFPGPRGA